MRGINDQESKMIIIDHSIDWLLSSIPSVFLSFYLSVYLVCFLILFLFFYSVLYFDLFSPENDMEVQAGRRGHLQNEREA